MADNNLESFSELAQNKTFTDGSKHSSETRLPKKEKSSHHNECLSMKTGYKACKYQKIDIRISRHRMQKKQCKKIFSILQ